MRGKISKALCIILILSLYLSPLIQIHISAHTTTGVFIDEFVRKTGSLCPECEDYEMEVLRFKNLIYARFKKNNVRLEDFIYIKPVSEAIGIYNQAKKWLFSNQNIDDSDFRDIILTTFLRIITLIWIDFISFIHSILNLNLDIIWHVWKYLGDHFAAFFIYHIHFHAGNFLSREYLRHASVGGIAASSPEHALSLLSVCLSVSGPFLPAGLSGESVSDSKRQKRDNQGAGIDALATI